MKFSTFQDDKLFQNENAFRPLEGLMNIMVYEGNIDFKSKFFKSI